MLSDVNDEFVVDLDRTARIVLQNDLQRVRELRLTRPGIDLDQWNAYAELGWLSLLMPNSQHNLVTGLRSLCLLSMRLGENLTPEPITAAAITASVLTGELSDLVQGGERIVLPAFGPTDQPLAQVHAGRISGTTACIPYGLAANAYLVPSDAGAAVVSSNSAGVTLRAIDTPDGGHTITLDLNEAPVTLIAADLPQLHAQWQLGQAAHMLGVICGTLKHAPTSLREDTRIRSEVNATQDWINKALATATTAGTSLHANASVCSESFLKSLAACKAVVFALPPIQDTINLGLFRRKLITICDTWAS